MSDKHGKADQPGSGKQPYHRPRLFVYGDVNKLTRAVTPWAGAVDGRTQMFGMFTIQYRS